MLVDHFLEYLTQAQQAATSIRDGQGCSARVALSAGVHILPLSSGKTQLSGASVTGMSSRTVTLVSHVILQVGEEFCLRLEKEAHPLWVRCAVVQSRPSRSGHLLESRFCDMTCSDAGESPILMDPQVLPATADSHIHHVARILTAVTQGKDPEPATSKAERYIVRAPRQEIRLEIDAEILDATIKDRKARIRLQDISTSGIGFTAKQALPVGTRLKMTFPMSPSKTIVAKIVRCVPLYPAGFRMGAIMIQR